jgi:hypothetical protein
MNRVLALVILMLAITACSSDPEPAFVPVEQQHVLTRLTTSKEVGYEVAGVPYYRDGRWTANVRIAGCKANITVAAQKAAEAVHPTSFTVTAVGDKPLAEFSPGTNGLFLLAEELKALPQAAKLLDCTP